MASREVKLFYSDLSVTKGIASRLNLTQEHFSRILHELSDLDLIQVDGRRLTIHSLRRA
jgi:CRP-like cAMP-binding protein